MRRTLSMFLSVLMVLSCMTAIFAVAASGEELISGTYPIGNALGLNDDEITIIAGAIEGNETTTVVDRTAYTHDSDFVPGDVNENKEVDHLDYAMVKRHVLGANFELTPEQQIIADVNVSGSVEAVDYAMIKRYVLGTYPDFPETIPVNEPGKTFDEYTVITVNAEGTVESVDAAAEGRDAVAIPEGGYVIAIPSKLISGDAAVYDISGIEKGTELKLDGVTVEEVAALTAPKALENASFSVVNAVEPEVGKYKILTFAGYASGDINLFLRLESGEKTLNDIGNKINNREATDYNAYKVLVADKDGFVTAIYTTTGRPDGVKGDVEVPEGGFAIGVNIYGDANNADYAAALAIFDTLKVGDYVELLNVDLEKDGTETVNEYSSFNVVSLDPVPDGASAIDFAQHWNANICTIYTRLETGEKTVGEVTAVTTGKAQDCKWWNAIVVDAEGKVVKVIGMVDKTDEEIPEGGYILLAHGSSPALSVLAGVPQGSTVTLYNCDLAAFAKLTEGTALKGAAFTYTEPEAVRALSYQKTYTIAKGDGAATYWTHWDASVGSLADDGKILTDGRRGSVNGDSHDYVAVNDLSGEGAYVKIVVDLGDTYFVDKFNAYTVSNKGEGGWGISEANFVRVKVSTDGETFTEVGFNENKQTLFVGTGAEGQWNSYESAIQLDKAVSARYVEFDVYNNGSFCWIDEVEVWEGEDPGEDPAVEPFKITVNVKDNAILTDGQTGFDGDWGTVGNSKVLLVANSECKTAPMEVTVIHELDAVKSVKSIALDLYHCAGVMIGYPEGKAVVSVSEDGTTYTEVGTYDLAAAELALGKYGTVTNKFEFDAVNAKFVKVVLNAGKSTDVLGETPADDKIYWEFISIAEVVVEEGAKDSLLDDAIWEGTEAIKVTAENGRWQNAREDALLTYDLTLTDDGEYFYVKVLGNGTFATEISTFRFWIRSNSEATVYTHFYDVDIAEDGTVTNKAKYNKSTTSNSGDNIANSSMEYDARATADGKTEIAFKVLLSEFNGAEGFAYYAALMKKGADYSYYPAPTGTAASGVMPYNTWDAEHEGWYGEKPAAEPFKITVNVKDNAILTDGQTGFDGDWGTVGNSKVLLVANSECKTAPMEVTVIHELDAVKSVKSIALDLYHCAGVMIGYPEGKAVVSVSEDGTTYTEVGSYDLAAAELALGKYGTVTNKFEFDAVNAKFVKVVLNVGKSTDVLGETPADDKIYWEFISIAEVVVEATDKPLDFSWVEGWTNVTGENGWEWQLDNVGKHKFDYAVQKDGENFKIAVKYYGDLYAIENAGAVNGNDTNGKATNLRVWFFDPNNTVNRKNFTGLVDVGYNGSKFFIDRVDEYNVTAKGKMTGEAIDFPGSFEAAVVEGGAEIALTIPASFISRDGGAQFILTLSTPLADGTNNTALFSHSINNEGKYKAAWNPWDSEHAIVFDVVLPDDAIVIDYAGYKHAGVVSILAGDGKTVAELTALGNDGVAKDLNYAYNILVDKDNKVIGTDYALSVPCTFVCPEGGYIISYNGNKAGYADMAKIKVGDTIKLYNVRISDVAALTGNKQLTNAGFTVTPHEHAYAATAHGSFYFEECSICGEKKDGGKITDKYGNEATKLQVSHNNTYSWGVYDINILSKAGQNATSLNNGNAFLWAHVYVVETVDGEYTVTRYIAPNTKDGETVVNNTVTCPENGFLMAMWTSTRNEDKSTLNAFVDGQLLNAKLYLDFDIAANMAINTTGDDGDGNLDPAKAAPGKFMYAIIPQAVSKGKTYTVAKGDGEATYWTYWDASVGTLTDDGKILTDGKKGSLNGPSHDYVAVNDLAGEGAYVKVVVDLGDICSVEKFIAYTASNKGDGGWGISEASFVRVKVSTDGETFTEVGTNENNQTLYNGTGAAAQWNSYESAIKLSEAVSARYVEFDVYNNGSFCWIDEVEVW